MMNKTKIKRYMKHYPDLLLLFTLLSVTTMIKAQISIRPYSEWEATQFVAVNGHQPEDYVTPDNNWEILYNLRTPRTQAELREMGIKCSDSQLLLLEVGGLVSKTKGKWETTIPILDKEQTNSLRSLSKEIAESMYVKTKADFISLVQTISEMGFKNNVLSLVFSYLLDGKMWTKLVLFEDVDNYTSWSGCYWVLYESRNGFACGTNGFGEDVHRRHAEHSPSLPRNGHRSHRRKPRQQLQIGDRQQPLAALRLERCGKHRTYSRGSESEQAYHRDKQ